MECQNRREMNFDNLWTPFFEYPMICLVFWGFEVLGSLFPTGSPNDEDVFGAVEGKLAMHTTTTTVTYGAKVLVFFGTKVAKVQGLPTTQQNKSYAKELMKWECAVKKCQLTSLTWVFGLCKYTFKVFASIMKYASSGSRALKMASVAEAGVVVQDANALLLHLLLLLHSVWAIKGVGAETPRKSTNATWLLQSLLLLLKNSKGDKTVFSCSVVPLSLLPLETGRTWDPILWSLVEVHSITSLDLKKKNL